MNEDLKRAYERFEKARGDLLAAVKAQGPETVNEYTFKATDGSDVMLSELFGDKDDLIVVHNMGKSCPYCTLWADGFIGVADHLGNRAAFVLTSPDEPETLRQFADGRGWKFRTLSTQGSTFARDMGYEAEPGKPLPGVSAFRREPGGTIVRTGHSPFGPGDLYCGVWHLLDLLKDGAAGWEPKYSYPTVPV